jgi:hypothetical protein
MGDSMSSQNEAHGDEDWMDVSDEQWHEAAIKIICDSDLLESQLNDTELVAPIADMMSCIDKACFGDAAALAALTRAVCHLKVILLLVVEDKAYEMASDE